MRVGFLGKVALPRVTRVVVRGDAGVVDAVRGVGQVEDVPVDGRNTSAYTARCCLVLIQG